jgi:indolepyruvate decarboxylase
MRGFLNEAFYTIDQRISPEGRGKSVGLPAGQGRSMAFDVLQQNERCDAMEKTVIEHVVSRLLSLGIRDVFGVAGDFAFPINDAIINHKKMRWIGSCNELNAAYSADGYARIHGMAALCTTYGVGELSAINGVAGSYTEHLPIFHLVGMPASRTQATRRLVHHTLGNGEFELFYKMAEPVTCARAIMTPENCAEETERLIAAALYHRRPVYMAFPTDYATSPVIGTALARSYPKSDRGALSAATTAILADMAGAKTVCALPGYLLSRTGLAAQGHDLIKTANLPFATMFWDKCVLDETSANFVGMYDGRLMNEEVRAFVENCDLVIGIGAVPTDFNTGSFTARIERAKSIDIQHHSVRVGEAVFNNVEMGELLSGLTGRIKREGIKTPRAPGLGNPIGEPGAPISVEYLYPRWEQMLKEGDILITETGTSSMGLGFARMPKGSVFHNQTMWGSIGWATPAAFGAALAAPQRRVLLITGEGSHQLTAQEVGQFHRFGLKPIIFVLNNDGYLIERLLCKDPESYYNDVAKWRYDKLPEALGCDGWMTERVTTCGEFDAAIKKAESCMTGAYIEVVTDRYAASPLSKKMHDSLETLYA